MAVDTPTHRQGFALGEDSHFSDFAMTGEATHALAHMNAVVKINVIGQARHPVPL